MTEQIKIAKAWARVDESGIDVVMGITDVPELDGDSPVHIVHGLSDEQLAAMIERERRMCEWGTVSYKGRIGYWTLCEEWQRVCGSAVDTAPTHCVCGCKIKIVARPAGEGQV